MNLARRKPLCSIDRILFFSRYQTSLVLIILSIVFVMVFSSVIGLYASTVFLFLPGLGIGIIMPFFHSSGILPVLHIVLYRLSR